MITLVIPTRVSGFRRHNLRSPLPSLRRRRRRRHGRRPLTAVPRRLVDRCERTSAPAGGTVPEAVLVVALAADPDYVVVADLCLEVLARRMVPLLDTALETVPPRSRARSGSDRGVVGVFAVLMGVFVFFFDLHGEVFGRSDGEAVVAPYVADESGGTGALPPVAAVVGIVACFRSFPDVASVVAWPAPGRLGLGCHAW